MRRGLSTALAALLLLSACGAEPPVFETFRHTVAYGVMVGGPDGGHAYTVTYTGADGASETVRPEGGKPWALTFEVDVTEGRGDFQAVLDVRLDSPLPPLPQMQCRIDVDGVQASASDEESTLCYAMEAVKAVPAPARTSAVPA